jgi:hypothetical protein
MQSYESLNRILGLTFIKALRTEDITVWIDYNIFVVEKNKSPESLLVIHIFVTVHNVFLSLEQIKFSSFCIVVHLNLESLNIAVLQCNI